MPFYMEVVTISFRGFFALNGVELINTTRTVAHMGLVPPTVDTGYLRPIQLALFESPPGSGLYMPAMDETPPGSQYYDTQPYDFFLAETPPGSGLYQTGQCSLVEHSYLLYELPDTAEPIVGRDRLYMPPDGSSRYGPGLILVEDSCWGFPRTCRDCRTHVIYDDSWPGLQDYLQDPIYRTQLAPWHSTQMPESKEFIGVWVTDVKGLGPLPVERRITELTGSGAVAGPHRDMSRTIVFEALLLACTHAGLEYGLDWLGCRLRETAGNPRSSLRFLNAHPQYTGADPLDLLREVHGVVLTKAPEVTDQWATGQAQYQQATMYRVAWEMTATSPYLYLPPVEFSVEWDEIIPQYISWVHQVDCRAPRSCEDVPVLFSTTCVPEVIDIPTEPPPVCGGCMPVCELDTYVWYMPTLVYPLRCRETAVTVKLSNTQRTPLTLQMYWQSCNYDVRCEDWKFPVQIAGLPPFYDIVLDAIQGRFWAESPYERPEAGGVINERQAPASPLPELGYRRPWRPVGIVGTPNGAPWRPAILDRQDCWQLVVVAPPGAQFSVSVSLADRDP